MKTYIRDAEPFLMQPRIIKNKEAIKLYFDNKLDIQNENVYQYSTFDTTSDIKININELNIRPDLYLQNIDDQIKEQDNFSENYHQMNIESNLPSSIMDSPALIFGDPTLSIVNEFIDLETVEKKKMVEKKIFWRKILNYLTCGLVNNYN